MELSINGGKGAVSVSDAVFGRKVQRRPRPPGGRRLPQRRSRGHQGPEDPFGSQRHHQEVEEAEGRRRASWRPDGLIVGGGVTFAPSRAASRRR